MEAEAPLWFVILGCIFLVSYILYGVFIKGPLLDIRDMIKGEKSGCGCLFGILSGIVFGGLLIWYIISELF